ncbi:MAG TPA: HAMP domain-containing sensor histidine kinase [Nocardioides sp.]
MGALLVVAVAMVAGCAVLVLLLRQSLLDGLETSAEQRAAALAAQIEQDGLPASIGEGDADRDEDEDPEDPEDPEDVVILVRGPDGAVVLASQPVARLLPDDDDTVRLPGADHDYVVVTEEAETDAGDHVVSVAVSQEDADESTAALLPLLALGLPIVLSVVGATTWVVVGRALAPVERMRRQVDLISGDDLGSRVEPPGSRDEIHRLALTMNAMLDRLEASRQRQRRFVSDASHELRSPLAGIRQTAEVAQAHPGALPEGELAEAVLEESVRMQRLVEAMLLLTRADEGGAGQGAVEVDLDDLALSEVDRARRLGAARGIAVDGSGIEPGRVLGDPATLGQVTRNLVDNALRHARSRVAVSVGVDGTGVWLVVDDDGAGVPVGERERIFERFVRLDEARARDDGGSGLGLAIVREIARAHGGEASVVESPDGGARFRVCLPPA